MGWGVSMGGYGYRQKEEREERFLGGLFHGDRHDLYHVVPSGGAADGVDCHGAGEHPDQSDLLEKRAEQGRSEIDRG